MFWQKRPSRIFFLQSDDAHPRLTSRRGMEELEYAVSRRHFDESYRNTGHIGSVISPGRIKVAIGLLSCILLIFLGKSAHLQINHGDYYRALAESNRFRTQRIMAQRGLIYDRHGVLLAKNEPSFILTMTIADLPTIEHERRELFLKVSELVGIQPTDLDFLLTLYSKSPNEKIPVKRHLPYEQAMRIAIETKQLPGFEISASSRRQYPTITLSLAHVLGYMGKIAPEEMENFWVQGYRPIDTIGKLGVERSAEALLRGTPGEIIVEVDARGKELSVVSKTDPISGRDIQLTIDVNLQAFIEARIENLFKATHTSRASVVMLNPKTGEIYALVSLPGYDNNQFALGIDQEAFTALMEDEDKPLFARAIAGEFPSGSTFKPFVAYGALAERIVSADTSFVSTGGLRIGEWFFPDWKAGGHGRTDVTKAIADSVNTYFYIVGGGFDKWNGLGVKKITDYAAKFGFGSPTGLDLPGEADGFLPSKEWKEKEKGERWYVGDTYHLAIGQGDFLTTPLQMAYATGIIANDGFRVNPHVIADDKPVMEREIEDLDAYALLVVKRAMRQTVLTGSARSLLALPFTSAGKTGTAQAPGHERYHSWFTGFAPYDNPQVAIVVLVEDGGESTESAVPLAREILYWWFLTNPNNGT